MIHVVAIITAKPGQRAAILEAFHANVPAVHAEDGCIEYGPAIDAEGVGPLQTPFGPDSFVVLEKWDKPRPPQGAWRVGAYEGVCREDEGADRQPGDPRAVAGLTLLPPGIWRAVSLRPAVMARLNLVRATYASTCRDRWPGRAGP